MRINKSAKQIKIEYDGAIHTGITDGSRTETKCGIIAKGISPHTIVFKRVGDEGSSMPECTACLAAIKAREMSI